MDEKTWKEKIIGLIKFICYISAIIVPVMLLYFDNKNQDAENQAIIDEYKIENYAEYERMMHNCYITNKRVSNCNSIVAKAIKPTNGQNTPDFLRWFAPLIIFILFFVNVFLCVVFPSRDEHPTISGLH